MLEHKVSKSFDGHATTHDALDCWEAGVVPTLNVALFDEPAKLALGKHCTDQVQLGVIVNYDGSDVAVLLNPVVKRISIAILNCAKSMSHPFDRVNDRTSHVISWVGLVLSASAVVRL